MGQWQNKKCEKCGRVFSPTSGRQRFCRVACREKPRKRSPEQLKRIGDATRRSWAAGKNRPAQSRQCRGCTREFSPNSGPQVYCSIECKKRSSTAIRHGLTVYEYEQLYTFQNGKCAICKASNGGWIRVKYDHSKTLVIDHDHKTGRVRGFLCGDCNTALGRFGDSSIRLRIALEYLESPPFSHCNTQLQALEPASFV